MAGKDLRFNPMMSNEEIFLCGGWGWFKRQYEIHRLEIAEIDYQNALKELNV